MKYIEIYLNERQKDLEKQVKEYIQRIKDDIETKTDKEIMENIVTDYSLYLIEICDRLEELDQLRKDLILDKEREVK